MEDKRYVARYIVSSSIAIKRVMLAEYTRGMQGCVRKMKHRWNPLNWRSSSNSTKASYNWLGVAERPSSSNVTQREWAGSRVKRRIRRDWIKVRQKLYVISFSSCIIHRWNDYSTPELRRRKHRFVNNCDRILPISEKRASKIIEGRRRRNGRNATEKREDRSAWSQDTETTRFEARMDGRGKRRGGKGIVVKQGKARTKEDRESRVEEKIIAAL